VEEWYTPRKAQVSECATNRKYKPWGVPT